MLRRSLPSLQSAILQVRYAPSLLLKYAFSSQQMPSRAAGNRGAADGTTNKQQKDDFDGGDVVDPHRKYTWDAYFHAKHASDVRSVQEGGFMDISKSDLQKYFPEGLAGDTASGFDLLGRSSWMIRDVTKILYSLLLDFETRAMAKLNVKTQKKANEISARFGKEVLVPNLTDRKEWLSARTSVKLYGKELLLSDLMPGTDFHQFNPPNFKDLQRVQPKDEFSSLPVYEQTLSRMKKSIVDDPEGYPAKILLTGDRGTGKSTVLSQIVYLARSRGWLCFFIPKGWDHVQCGSYVEPVTTNSGEVKYDNVFMSAESLRGFWNAHSSILKKIPISNKNALKKYTETISRFREAWNQSKTIGGREKSSFINMRRIVEDSDAIEVEDAKDEKILVDFDFMSMKLENLNDLVLLGIALRDLAGLVVIDVVEELKQLECEHPVLLAVDQINTWSVPSVYGYEGKVLMPSDICVPYALDFTSRKKKDVLNKVNVKNGLCIGAVSSKHIEGNKTDFTDVAKSFPLLIQVPVYNKIEYLSIVQCYTYHGIFDSSHGTDEILALRSFCNSNPRLVAKESASFLLPISQEFEDGGESDDQSPGNLKSNVLESDSEFWYDNTDKIFDVAPKVSSASAESVDAAPVTGTGGGNKGKIKKK